MTFIPSDMDYKKNTTGARQDSLNSNRESRIQKREPRDAVRSSIRLKDIQHTSASRRAESEQQYRQPPESVVRRRKRSQEVEAPTSPGGTEERHKRARIAASDTSSGEDSGQSVKHESPIAYWSRHGHWPEGYSEQSADMSHPLARKKSELSMPWKGSDTSSTGQSITTPSDDKPRELKSIPYKHPGFMVFLGTLGIFMDESDRGITKSSKTLCQSLLETLQGVPIDTLFRDDLFEETCKMVSGRNEAKVIQDLSRLIVPSAQTLAVYGSKHLKGLTESVNEGWNNSIPFFKPRPQPDYAVGFRREAFTSDQLKKLEPFTGGVFDASYFMATYHMFFPFLTCEVKCGAMALDTADRQNAHSMTLAVRSVVEIFRLAKREQDLDREILAFSISHNDKVVRIYGHYAEIDGREQKYYRYPIHEFSISAQDGKEKWTAYRFTKNVYDIWMPKHFERMCNVIDQLPTDINFELSQQSELQFTEHSGLSQDFQASSLAQSSTSSQSRRELVDNQSSVVDPQNPTPNTSVNDDGSFKRPTRKRGRKATITSSP